MIDLNPEENTFKIQEIWAYILSGNQGEGIIGEKTNFGWVPLVAADVSRLKSLRPIAKNIAKNTKKEVKLVKFSVREDIETIYVENEKSDT